MEGTFTMVLPWREGEDITLHLKIKLRQNAEALWLADVSTVLQQESGISTLTVSDVKN